MLSNLLSSVNSRSLQPFPSLSRMDRVVRVPVSLPRVVRGSVSVPFHRQEPCYSVFQPRMNHGFHPGLPSGVDLDGGA